MFGNFDMENVTLTTSLSILTDKSICIVFLSKHDLNMMSGATGLGISN